MKIVKKQKHVKYKYVFKVDLFLNSLDSDFKQIIEKEAIQFSAHCALIELND